MNSQVLTVKDTVITETNPIKYDVVLEARNTPVSEDEIRAYIRQEYFNPRLLCSPPDHDIGRVVFSKDGELEKVELTYTIAEWCRERLENAQQS
jgi:hypothetical protein